MKLQTNTKIIFMFIMLLGLTLNGLAADWPQFRGPNRDGKSTETGLLQVWPTGGPKELWAVENLGMGYASVAVVGDTIYTTGMENKQGFLYAFDLQGRLKWKKQYGPEWTGSYPGTRTTPTLDGDRLYLMSGQGRIACFNALTGDAVWHIDTLKTFRGKNIRWGIAESVLVDGDKVICTPGGQNATVVALNKMNGQTVWTTQGLSDLSAYCSPMLVERGGTRLIVTMVQKHIVGIDADSGTVYWRIPHQTSYDISAVSPLYHDGMIFVTNGYKKGSFGLKLSKDGKSCTQAWAQKKLDVHHGGAVLLEGTIHGASTGKRWINLDIATGEINYQDRLVGKGAVLYADGLLYGYGENGQLAIIKPGPDGYRMISSFKITKGEKEHWAHPAITNGRLYVRHGTALMAFDIKAK